MFNEKNKSILHHRIQCGYINTIVIQVLPFQFFDGIHLYKYLGADENVVSVIYICQDSEDS